jgi:hypothetical protein
MRYFALHACLLCALPGLVMMAGCDSGDDTTPFHATVTDMAGNSHELPVENAKATVLIFLNVDCPIANAMAPAWNALVEEYTGQGVAFLRIYADPWLEPDDIQAHGESYAHTTPAIFDCPQTLARQLEARVTPEAFVLLPDGVLFYRGRVNDSYADVGAKRPQVHSQDLEEAIKAALDGHTAPLPSTRAVGCYIEYADNPECEEIS